jgi:hypothetical protein
LRPAEFRRRHKPLEKSRQRTPEHPCFQRRLDRQRSSLNASILQNEGDKRLIMIEDTPISGRALCMSTTIAM